MFTGSNSHGNQHIKFGTTSASERTYMIVLEEGSTPQFKKESELTRVDIGHFLAKITQLFNPLPDYIKDVFISILAKNIGAKMEEPEFPLPFDGEPSYRMFPGTPQETEKKVSQFTDEDIWYFINPMADIFNRSPLLARDYFTRAVLENYGIHIPGEVPDIEKRQSPLILPDHYNTTNPGLRIIK